MNQKQVCEKFFWWQRGQFKGHKQTAAHFGVSVGYVSQVCCGRKAPNETMLKAIGLQLVVSYEPLPLEDDKP